MNLSQQVEQHLPGQLLRQIGEIRTQAAGRGEKVYLVGGIVRDLLLGEPSLNSGLRFDLDLVIEGDAVGLAQDIAETGQAKLLTHQQFGTARLDYESFTMDMATARKETYAKPGALPAVTPGTLKDDLFRRDFSINAMAISLAADDYGHLIDPYQGRSDLEHRLIRVLHPRSFSDDPTRILRAVRYEQRLGFALEAQTARLLKRDAPVLDMISGDRIRHELELIFREDRPECAISHLAELEVLQRIDPSLTADKGMVDRFQRARQPGQPEGLPSLFFCLLVYALSISRVEQFLIRLNTPAKLAHAIRDTLRLKTELTKLESPSLKPSEIYDLLQEYDTLALEANAIASEYSTAGRHLRLFLTELRYVRPTLNGEALKRLGISSGPEMGEILRTLRKARLDGEVSTKEEEERLTIYLTACNSHKKPEPDPE